jgi:hypothetical protein
MSFPLFLKPNLFLVSHCCPQMQMLRKEDYAIFLAEPLWDLAYIPFILLGYKVFDAEIDMNKDFQESLVDEAILKSFRHLYSAIGDKALKIAGGSSLIEFPIDIAIRCPESFIIKNLLYDLPRNTDRLRVSIKASDVINWALFNNVRIGHALLDVLGVYREPGNRKPSQMSKPESHKIKFLAEAKVLWHYFPSKNKTEIFADPSLKEYRYSKSRAFEFLSLVDPTGTKRKPGRPNSTGHKTVMENPIIQPIPGICFGQEGKIDVRKAKIVIQTTVKAVKKHQTNIGLNDLKEHQLVKIYLQNHHPMLETIVSEWISEAFNSYSAYNPSDQGLLEEYLLRWRVNGSVRSDVTLKSLPKEIREDLLTVAKYHEGALSEKRQSQEIFSLLEKLQRWALSIHSSEQALGFGTTR